MTLNLYLAKEQYEGFQGSLNRLLDRIKDLKPVWKKFIPEYQDYIKSNFDTEGEATGGKWAQYNPYYAAMKGSRKDFVTLQGKSNNLLKATQGGNGWDEKIENRTLTMWLTAPDYAKYHQNGATWKPKPAQIRAFWGKFWRFMKDRPKKEKRKIRQEIKEHDSGGVWEIPQRPFFYDKYGKVNLQVLNKLNTIMLDYFDYKKIKGEPLGPKR